MKTVEFEFGIEQHVKICGTTIDGFVDGLMLSGGVKKALVIYYDNDKVQRTEWVNESRLESC